MGKLTELMDRTNFLLHVLNFLKIFFIIMLNFFQVYPNYNGAEDFY